MTAYVFSSSTSHRPPYQVNNSRCNPGTAIQASLVRRGLAQPPSPSPPTSSSVTATSAKPPLTSMPSILGASASLSSRFADWPRSPCNTKWRHARPYRNIMPRYLILSTPLKAGPFLSPKSRCSSSLTKLHRIQPPPYRAPARLASDAHAGSPAAALMQITLRPAARLAAACRSLMPL
ncbi:hypothetical protein TgHK011_003174 [Trichoderma gracile]|nr:hypothetical protein TgHK011_003174 [Trichoderma gracile]